jgi:hypothetical protein
VVKEPMKAQKAEFELTLFDDEKTRKKLTLLNTLETMFDDERNILPPEYFYFSNELPLGTKVRVTFEVL